jgi:PPE-repeat protein
MDFALPPEITSTLIYTGPGPASLVEASSAWSAVTEELESFVAQHSSVIADVNSAWIGPSDVAMRMASFRIMSWAQQTAAHAAQMTRAAASAAAAFETVHATITPPAVVYANRVMLAQLIATNILGQNFPAIAANEAQYAEMWAVNTSSMSTYEVSSAQATTPLTGFQSLLSNLPGLSGIFTPGSNQETAGIAGLLNLLSGQTGSAFGSFLNSGIINTVFSSGFYTPASWFGPFAGFLLGQNSTIAADDGKDGLVFMRPPVAGKPPLRVTVEQPEPSYSAQLGAGKPLGGLTVPPTWTKPPLTTPAPRPGSTVNIVNAAPAVEASGIPLPLPLPLPMGLKGGTPPKTDKPPPEYGQSPTVMPKNPYGG